MNDVDPDGLPSGGEPEEEAVALPPFLLDPWGVLRRRWPWMLAALGIGLALTAAATRLLEPTYIASASLLIRSQEIPEDFVRSTVQEDTLANINAMAGELLARENLARLVADLELSPRPNESQRELLDRLRADVEISPLSGSRGRQLDALIVGIEFRSEDAQEAAAVANGLATLFTEASIARRSSQAERTTGFLVRQLEQDEAELRTQSQLLSEFRREHRGELPSELESNLRRLQLLSERRQSLLAQIAAAENRILTLRATPGSGDASENALLLASLRRELARESAANTDEHPNVIALRERIARLRQVVAQEARSNAGSQAVASEQRTISLLRSQLAETESSIEEVSARVDRIPAVAEQLAAIEQKEQVLRERYLASLRKVEDSELAENLERAQQGARISILDRAGIPRTPERPPWMIALLGAAGSLALALALAVLLELVDPVVVSVAQIEKLAYGRCLGSLPELG